MASNADVKHSRYLNIAMAYISGGSGKRGVIKVHKSIVRAALIYARDLIDEAVAEMDRPTQRKQAVLKAEVAKKKEKEELERVRQFKAHQEWRMQRTKEINAKVSATRKRTGQLAAIGKHVVSLFDSVEVGGRPIGAIWYSQLSSLRDRGAFEAALCQSILMHGKPAEDVKIRDMITEKTLARFVQNAKRAVEKVKAAA